MIVRYEYRSVLSTERYLFGHSYLSTALNLPNLPPPLVPELKGMCMKCMILSDVKP